MHFSKTIGKHVLSMAKIKRWLCSIIAGFLNIYFSFLSAMFVVIKRKVDDMEKAFDWSCILLCLFLTMRGQ